MDIQSAKNQIGIRSNEALREIMKVSIGQDIPGVYSSLPSCRITDIDRGKLQISVVVSGDSDELGVKAGQRLNFFPEIGFPGRWESTEQVLLKGWRNATLLLVITDSEVLFGAPETHP